MNFSPGINKIKWQLVLIPGIALVISIAIALSQTPQSKGFRFPVELFFTLGLFTFIIWEVNLLVYRRLDMKLPFFDNPRKRLSRQVIFGLLATIFSFTILFLIMTWLLTGPFQLRVFLKFLTIASGISFLINSLYVYQYLQQSIFYREDIKTQELNSYVAGVGRQKAGDRFESLPASELKSILIEAGNKSLNIPINDIAFFISGMGVVTLVKCDGQKLTTNYNSFSMITNRLPSHLFFQLNRQFITHLQSISSIADGVNRKLTIIIAPAQQPGLEERVTVSRYRNPEFKRWFSKQLAGGV